jgi:Eukaryotic translation initiation factor 3 subunit 8 N-terminus
MASWVCVCPTGLTGRMHIACAASLVQHACCRHPALACAVLGCHGILLSARGWSDVGTNMRVQVEMLEYLAKVAKGPTQKLEVRCRCAARISLQLAGCTDRVQEAAFSLNACACWPQVLVHVVSALFDINPSMSTHMPVHLWKKCVATLLDILALLDGQPHISLDEHFDGGEAERTGAESKTKMEAAALVGEVLLRLACCSSVSLASGGCPGLLGSGGCPDLHRHMCIQTAFWPPVSRHIPLQWWRHLESMTSPCLHCVPTEEPPEGEEVKVWGNLVANVERLDDELFKSLQVHIPRACCTCAYIVPTWRSCIK